MLEAVQNQGKLVVNQEVEVRNFDEGLLGSWHRGTVIACENEFRRIRYHHLQKDDNSSEGLLDCVKTPAAINDVIIRGWIRPFPSPVNAELSGLHYAQCVDMFYEDAWWEGVVFDHEDNSPERIIFFPDIGDEMRAHTSQLRVTQDWNDNNDEWTPRGDWIFLHVVEDAEKEWPVLVSIKQIWYDVRAKKGFLNLKEWTSTKYDVWMGLVLDVIVENFQLTLSEFFERLNLSPKLLEEAYQHLEVNRHAFFGLSGEKTQDTRSLDIILLNCVENSKNLSVNNEGSAYKVPLERTWRSWLPPAPGAQLCKDVVTEYYNSCKAGSPTPQHLSLDFRRHLLFLGWKIEYRPRNNGSKFRWRYTYTQPNGERKSFKSLNHVCEFLVTSSSFVCPNISDSQHADRIQGCDEDTTSREYVTFQPVYCPQAITDYCARAGKILDKPGLETRKLALEAKQHLSSIGWRFFYTVKIVEKQCKRRFRCMSPSGKVYFTLVTACKGCIDGEKESASEIKVQAKGTRGRKRKIDDLNVTVSPHVASEVLSSSLVGGDGQRLPEMQTKESSSTSVSRRTANVIGVQGRRKFKRKRKNDTLISASRPPKSLNNRNSEKFGGAKPRNVLNNDASTPRLHSRRRPHRVMVPSSSNSNPQTVLSWLIDNNMVLPMTRVHSRGTENNAKIAEGWVTRHGIRCSCCEDIFTLRSFQVHSGSSCFRPSANIYLEDGRSLFECQLQLTRDIYAGVSRKEVRALKNDEHPINDDLCSICHLGGDLIMCDGCPSSFHTACLGLEGVPSGDWFCLWCCCNICCQRIMNEDMEDFKDNVIRCHQCELQAHVGCLNMKSFMADTYPRWFCNRSCEQIYFGLQKLLGKPVSVGEDSLTWTLLKNGIPENCNQDSLSFEDSVEDLSKLNLAMRVMHECFDPVKEPRSGRDLIKDVIFNRSIKLHQLNFEGFYTVVLEKDEEVITAATVRIYGEKVAEVPFVATRFIYRRHGMCRILMNKLEKVLKELGVQRLVLPAASSALDTWISSFGFSTITESERYELVNYKFLGFASTTMCHKVLLQNPSKESEKVENGNKQVSDDNNGNVDTKLDSTCERPFSEAAQSNETAV